MGDRKLCTDLSRKERNGCSRRARIGPATRRTGLGGAAVPGTGSTWRHQDREAEKTLGLAILRTGQYFCHKFTTDRKGPENRT